jgi:hypothetical protein
VTFYIFAARPSELLARGATNGDRGDTLTAPRIFGRAAKLLHMDVGFTLAKKEKRPHDAAFERCENPHITPCCEHFPAEQI